MERFYVYYGALAIIGILVGTPAMYSLIGGDQSIEVLLKAIGGGIVIISAGYGLLRTDPADFTIPTSAFIGAVGGACLIVLGTILSTVFGM